MIGCDSPVGIAVVGAHAQLLVFGRLWNTGSIVVFMHACACEACGVTGCVVELWAASMLALLLQGVKDVTGRRRRL